MPFIYGFGSNGSGQLDIGHKEDTAHPQQVTYHPAARIADIKAGGNHTLILTTDGYAFSTKTDALVDDSVVQVSATWSANMCLTKNGVVLSGGSGSSGELGQGESCMQTLHPAQTSNFPPPYSEIVQLASSMGHTVAVLSNGEVWGWGKGRSGQLGEPAENVWKPRKVEGIPFPVEKAACGKDFTCFIRDDGRLHLLGPKRDKFDLRATLPAAVPNWKDICASWGSVYVLTSSGALHGFGRGDHGQLPPQNLPPIEVMVAGSEHCLALTKTGKVLAWGWGEHGNCGEPTDSHGDVSGRCNEIEVLLSRGQRVVGVYAGCATSFVVVDKDAGETAQDADRG